MWKRVASPFYEDALFTKMKYIDPGGAKRHDWIAYSAEWTPDSRTVVGQFAKKFYRPRIKVHGSRGKVQGAIRCTEKRGRYPLWGKG